MSGAPFPFRTAQVPWQFFLSLSLSHTIPFSVLVFF